MSSTESAIQLTCSQTHICFHTCGHFVTDTYHDINCPSPSPNYACIFLQTNPPLYSIQTQHTRSNCPWCVHDHKLSTQKLPVHDTRAFNFRRSDAGIDKLSYVTVQQRRNYWYSLMWDGWKGEDVANEVYLEDMREDVWHCLGNEELEFEMWREEGEEREYLRYWQEMERFDDESQSSEDIGEGVVERGTEYKSMEMVGQFDRINALIAELERKTPTATQHIQGIVNQHHTANTFPRIFPNQLPAPQIPTILLTPPQSEGSPGRSPTTLLASPFYRSPTPPTPPQSISSTRPSPNILPTPLPYQHIPPLIPPPNYTSRYSMLSSRFSLSNPRANLGFINGNMDPQSTDYLAHSTYRSHPSLPLPAFSRTLFSFHRIPHTYDPDLEFELVMEDVYSRLLFEQGVPVEEIQEIARRKEIMRERVCGVEEELSGERVIYDREDRDGGDEGWVFIPALI